MVFSYWHTTSEEASTTRTPQDVVPLVEQTNRALLGIVRDNLNTQCASQAPFLTGFRDAISVHGGHDIEDAALLADFWAHVPLTTYDAYKPFIDKFDAAPCRLEDVENLMSPGLPDLLVMSSATSGMDPKVLPKYNHQVRLGQPPRLFFDPKSTPPLAGVVCTRYRNLKEVEGAQGSVMHKIPVCVISGGAVRRTMGWYTDEESQMAAPIAGYAVPWAATVIGYLPSFLVIHGLFFLVRRDLSRFYTPFATVFVDLIRHIDERWDLLVSSIRNGTLPDLQGIDHVRNHLQAQLVADPERAAELLNIGPPSSCEGWAARVWPGASELTTIYTGPFATVLPKMRTVLGPNVAIRGMGYGASEAVIGFLHGVNTQDEFVLRSEDVIEFLDVSQDNESHAHIHQAWQVQAGKQYEPILTTRDGLWRYRLGDVLSIVGFDAASSAPVFKYTGRRSMVLRLPHTQITDDQLVAAVRASNSADTTQVQEFTTIVDDRILPPTVGFLVELAGPLGPNARQAPQLLFDALVTTNPEHAHARENGQMRLPTIRIVDAGTFAEYRRWKAENANVAFGQIKVPLVLTQPSAQEWILDRVVTEI